MSAGKSAGKSGCYVFLECLIETLIADQKMLSATLSSMTLFATLIAGFGLGTGASLTFEDVEAYAQWRVSVGYNDNSVQTEAVLEEKEWVDHIMGKATLNCTSNGLLCAMFCMAAYTMATEENCKVLGNVSAAPFKTHRVVLWILKASLILFVLSGFITFCASVFYFQYLCLRAIPIKVSCRSAT